MISKERLIQEIEQTPHDMLDKVLNFIQLLKSQKDLDQKEILAYSESSLKKDWLLPEEDRAWQNL